MRDDSLYLSKEKLLNLLPNIDKEYLKVLFSLTFLTGGRISEVLALKKLDITHKYIDGDPFIEILVPNLKQKKIKFTKDMNWLEYVRSQDKKTALIDLGFDSDLWEIVSNYIKDMNETQLIFESNCVDGQSISRQWAWRQAKKYLDMGTHKAGRHSYVMTAADRDTTFLDVKEQGGWKTSSSMDRYIHKFGITARARRLKDRREALHDKLKESNDV